jgi:hypothetical protein
MKYILISFLFFISSCAATKQPPIPYIMTVTVTDIDTLPSGIICVNARYKLYQLQTYTDHLPDSIRKGKKMQLQYWQIISRRSGSLSH